MKLSPRFTLLMLVSFVLPAAGMGIFGRDSMRRTEEQATRQAITLVDAAERSRLLEVAKLAARSIEADLARVEWEVSVLRATYERAPAGPETAAQRKLADTYADHATPGMPGYGFVDPVWGVYADHLGRSSQGPWIPRPTMRRASGDPGLQATLGAELHRLADVGPAMQDLAGRVGPNLDLAWIVTTTGAATVWPPYDVPATIAENPEVVDLDESTMDYVTLAAPDRNPERGPRWTKPYLDRFKGVWLTSVIHPLYIDDTFHGTAGADLLLSAISDRVTSLSLEGPGYPLLVDQGGAIIATTPALLADLDAHAPWKDALAEALKPPTHQRWTQAREEALSTASITTAGPTGWQDLARLAAEPEAGEHTVMLGGTARVVVHVPVAGPGWRLLLVIPEAAVTERALAVGATIERGAGEVAQQFSLFAGAVLLLTVASSRLVKRFAVDPVESLARRVGALNVDHLQLAADDPRSDEFGDLEENIRELLRLLAGARDGERAERARVQATLASIRDAVVGTDADGVVRLVNVAAEFLLGPQAALIGARLTDVCHLRRADGSMLNEPAHLLGLPGSPLARPERFTLAHDTGERVIELHCAPLELPGETAGAVFVLRDITERDRLDDELVRIQKLESVQGLAAGVAHDFNNVLAGVLGYIALARASLPAGSTANAQLERAENAVDRARAVTTRLLTFSESGDPVRRRALLSPVLDEAVNIVRRAGFTPPRPKVQGPLWEVRCDPAQVSQVAAHLLDNACRAAQQVGGTVEWHATNGSEAASGLPAGRYVVVTIVDTGGGIPQAIRGRVGDAFFTTRPGASGLGIAVSESILRKHGGAMQIDSVEGSGTTVRFWLPVEEEAPTVAAAVPLADERPRVLFLDDDADLREVTEAMLRRCGFEPSGFADGREALTAWLAAREADVPYHLVVLDLTVPNGMGGAETLGEMRLHDPNVLAVVCSGYAKEGVLADPVRYGFKGRLHKPFDLATMKSELWRVLRGLPASG